MAIRSVCVFCGSSAGDRPVFAEAAEEMGRLIGTNGLRFVFGGGNIGLMGISSRAAMAAGGHVSGVIPEFLRQVEAPRLEVSEMIVVDTMHMRKQMMFDLTDAFIILPGGIGTLDEFAEMMSWAILGRHEKPIIVVNVEGYFDPLLAFFRHMLECKFAQPALERTFRVATTPAEAIALLINPA